jgi:hypothetical protein
MVNTVLPEFLKFYFFYPTEGGPPGRILLFTHRYPKKQRHAFWFCRDSAEDDVNPIRRPHLAPMESRLALEVATYLKERLNVRVWNARVLLGRGGRPASPPWIRSATGAPRIT